MGFLPPQTLAWTMALVLAASWGGGLAIVVGWSEGLEWFVEFERMHAMSASSGTGSSQMVEARNVDLRLRVAAWRTGEVFAAKVFSYPA